MKVVHCGEVITGQIVRLFRQFGSILVSLRIEMDPTGSCILAAILIRDIFQNYLN